MKTFHLLSKQEASVLMLPWSEDCVNNRLGLEWKSSLQTRESSELKEFLAWMKLWAVGANPCGETILQVLKVILCNEYAFESPFLLWALDKLYPLPLSPFLDER